MALCQQQANYILIIYKNYFYNSPIYKNYVYFTKLYLTFNLALYIKTSEFCILFPNSAHTIPNLIQYKTSNLIQYKAHITSILKYYKTPVIKRRFKMEILKIIILSFSSAIFLFILTKLMGNKEMSQLSMFDYIIGITIGSIAAEMSTALESSFTQPLVAMAIYAIISILLSIFSNKSLKFRRLIYGNTLILYNNGEIFKNNLKKAKMDLNEFLTQCRTARIF